MKNIKVEQQKKAIEKFDDEAQKEFIKGAKIATRLLLLILVTMIIKLQQANLY